MLKDLVKSIFGAGILAFASVATAVPISGVINFAGEVTTNTNNVLTATTFNFLNPIDVTSSSGGFAPLAGDTVIYSSLTVPSAPFLTPFGAISPLWSANVLGTDYSFDLTSLTANVASNLLQSRTIAGLGTFTIDDGSSVSTQAGIWRMTTQNPGTGSPVVRFSFSSVNVPEPLAVGLVSLGLLGIGTARRLRKS